MTKIEIPRLKSPKKQDYEWKSNNKNQWKRWNKRQARIKHDTCIPIKLLPTITIIIIILCYNYN